MQGQIILERSQCGEGGEDGGEGKEGKAKPTRDNSRRGYSKGNQAQEMPGPEPGIKWTDEH